MSASHKKSSAPAAHTTSDIVATAYKARDVVRDHLNTSLALCDDILARCEQMKSATRKQ